MLFNTVSLILQACGSKSTSENSQDTSHLTDSTGPQNDETKQLGSTTIANLSTMGEPYWIAALGMPNAQRAIGETLMISDRQLYYAFPKTEPEYDKFGIEGWSEASEAMKLASAQIFSALGRVLDTEFSETTDLSALNVIAISTSVQEGTSGLSFFPDTNFFAGMDVFISTDYSDPLVFSNKNTNFDFEVLLHEIGHALGLKHPHESMPGSPEILSSEEDTTTYTAMSYEEVASSFNGTFRVLDWMTLTKYYGVNSDYNSGNDAYTFSNSGGVFIIDGGGIDIIDARDAGANIWIDLRSGTQSYLGEKLELITKPKQLTISHGTIVENVITGRGNDTIIGNNVANVIQTGAGDDIIYAGEGADVIDAGAGQNQIDLSEVKQALDILVFDTQSLDEFADTVYGFAQGLSGDALELSGLITTLGKFLPLFSTQNVPIQIVDSSVVRLIGSEIESAAELSDALYDGGVLENLILSEKASAVFVVATNQGTGVTQNLYYTSFDGDDYSSFLFAQFIGDFMDIDSWTANNFEAPETIIIA